MSYTATVTASTPHATKCAPDGTGRINGSVDITAYNTTLAEVTDITKHFKDTPYVICDGATDNGYVVRWNTTSKSFNAYVQASAGAMTEATDDTDIGAFNFVAFGQVGA